MLEHVAWPDAAMESIAIERRDSLQQIGLDALLAPSRPRRRGCYAGAMAVALTCSGRPTGVNEVELHWNRRPDQFPGFADVAQLNRWVLSIGKRMQGVYPEGRFVPLEPYYREGSCLGLEDYIEAWRQQQGDEEAGYVQQAYAYCDKEEFERQMAIERDIAQRYPGQVVYDSVSNPYHPRILADLLRTGPVLADTPGSSEATTHQITLIDVHSHLQAEQPGEPCYGYVDPDPAYYNIYGVTEPEVRCLSTVQWLHPTGALTAIGNQA